MLIGDCANNARAALDYIMWGLACKYFDPAPIVGDLISFPIAHDPDWLRNKVQSFTNKGLPTGPIDEIKASQPCYSGDQSLVWLQEIVNQDKHRKLVLAVSNFDNVKLAKVVGGIHTLLASSIGDTIEAPIWMLGGLTDEMYVNPQITISITLQKIAVPNIPVDVILEQTLKCIADIIPRFELSLS